MADGKSDDDNGNLKYALSQAGDGVIGAAILIVVGVLLGRWLDEKLHTAPLLLIIFPLLGGALGLVRLVQKAMLIDQHGSDKKTKRG